MSIVLIAILYLLPTIACGQEADSASFSKTEAGSKKVITTVAEIRCCTLKEAATRIPVRLTGVITYCNPSEHHGFVQDSSGGIHFTLKNWKQDLSRGDLVVLEGETEAGTFSPHIASDQSLVRLSARNIQMPSPILLGEVRHLKPSLHNQWCEFDGILVDISPTDFGATATFCADGYEVNANLPSMREAMELDRKYQYCEVRVACVYGARFSMDKQMVAMEVFIPDIHSVTPIDPVQGSVFNSQVESLDGVLQFDHDSADKVLLEGQCLAMSGKDNFYLWNSGNCILIESSLTNRPRTGDSVQVYGSIHAGANELSIRGLTIRSDREFPAPLPTVRSPAEIMAQGQSQFVRTQATFRGQFRTLEKTIFLLAADEFEFTAELPSTEKVDEFNSLVPDSQVEVAGVVKMTDAATWNQVWEDKTNLITRAGRSFSLLLPNTTSIQPIHVDRDQQWWVVQVVFPFFIVLSSVGFGVGTTLIFKLRKKRRLLNEANKQALIQSERSRIARDLHDTLQQNLVGVLFQINTAKSREDPEASNRDLQIASRMIHHSLQQVRETVWELRKNSLGFHLPTAIQEIARLAEQNRNCKIQIDLASSFEQVSGYLQYQLFCMTKEAIENATVHANAKQLIVLLAVKDEQVLAQINDDGIGFDPESVKREIGHFGLIGMQERAKKLNGKVTVVSHLGHGTSITITIPVSNGKTLPCNKNECQ